MPSQRPILIDPQAAQRWQQMPLQTSPWLHEEVARRMQERLDWIKLQPSSWAHWQAARGGLQAHALLTRRYPDANCFVVEPNVQSAHAAADLVATKWWQPARWRGAKTRVEMPPDGAVQMLWSNMSLHMAADPIGLMQQWHRTLATGGFLMFSCLGPDTLQELRHIYEAQGWPAPCHAFTDMHDWGDRLAGIGFAEPVMDMERITLTFETPQRLLQELRGLGRNLHPLRLAGLRGRGWYAQLQQALAQAPLHLSFEVIYGHAFKPPARLPVQAETVLSLAQMQETLRQRKTYPNNP